MTKYQLNNRITSPIQWINVHKVNLAAFFFFLALTVIAAWPIVTNLDGVIIGDDPDVYINPWADWWTTKALSDPDISLWQTEMMFYPNGANLIYHSFSHLNTLVSLSLRPFLGALPAYNLTILLNYVLIGFSMFQLARYFTKSTIAGLLAGIVFAFNSHSQYQSAHPVLVSIWCFPWMTLYFVRAVRENNVKLAFVAALFVFLGAATSTVLVILMALWMAFLILYMFASQQFPRPSWQVILTFGFFSAILVLPLVLPLLLDAITNRNDSFIANPANSIITDMISIFIPHWYFWLKRGMYLGIIPFCLAFFTVGQMHQKSRLWLYLVVLAYLFAIGPIPSLFGYNIDIVLPWSQAVAPLLRNMYRMMILMAMGWALVTAYGWLGLKSLLDSTKTKPLIIATIIGLAIFVDYTAAPFPHTPATVSPFYTDYLDAVPDDVVLAILPTGRQEDKRYMFYQIFHKHPMTNGVISRAGKDVFSFIFENQLLRAGANDDDPVPIPSDPEPALRQLAEKNVGFLVIDKNLMRNVEQWREALPFIPVYEDDELLVYTTEAHP